MRHLKCFSAHWRRIPLDFAAAPMPDLVFDALEDHPSITSPQFNGCLGWPHAEREDQNYFGKPLQGDGMPPHFCSTKGLRVAHRCTTGSNRAINLHGLRGSGPVAPRLENYSSQRG